MEHRVWMAWCNPKDKIHLIPADKLKKRQKNAALFAHQYPANQKGGSSRL